MVVESGSSLDLWQMVLVLELFVLHGRMRLMVESPARCVLGSAHCWPFLDRLELVLLMRVAVVEPLELLEVE